MKFYAVILMMQESWVPIVFKLLILFLLGGLIIYLIYSHYNQPTLEQLMNERYQRKLYEAYLRAVRSGAFTQLLNPSDIAFVNLGDHEFELKMLEMNSSNMVLLHIHKDENFFRIRQAEMRVGWEEVPTEDDHSIEYQLMHSKSPTPDARGANSLTANSDILKRAALRVGQRGAKL